MKVPSSCAGLFIDFNYSIYCSIWVQHLIIRQSLQKNPSTFHIGLNRIQKNQSIQLNNLRGIYVDHLFNLYVSHCGNHRIQLFEYQTNSCHSSSIDLTIIEQS